MSHADGLSILGMMTLLKTRQRLGNLGDDDVADRADCHVVHKGHGDDQTGQSPISASAVAQHNPDHAASGQEAYGCYESVNIKFSAAHEGEEGPGYDAADDADAVASGREVEGDRGAEAGLFEEVWRV
ncbi:hypothetical protein HG530_005976 [Fusarium avenaceum]|nr:hypothetical protein HG530_005976 [Fusarium avenaceum]